MDLKELKKLVAGAGTLVLLEQDKPELVLMSYAQFRQLAARDGNGLNDSTPQAAAQDEDIERLNREILALKEQIHQSDAGGASQD